MALGNEPRVVAYGADALENLLPLPLTDGGAALKVAVIDGEGPGPAGTKIFNVTIGASTDADLIKTIWTPAAGKAIVLSAFRVDVPSGAAGGAVMGTRILTFLAAAQLTGLETRFTLPTISSNTPPAHVVNQAIPMGYLLPVDAALRVSINSLFSNNIAALVTVFGYEV